MEGSGEFPSQQDDRHAEVGQFAGSEKAVAELLLESIRVGDFHAFVLVHSDVAGALVGMVRLHALTVYSHEGLPRAVFPRSGKPARSACSTTAAFIEVGAL